MIERGARADAASAPVNTSGSRRTNGLVDRFTPIVRAGITAAGRSARMIRSTREDETTGFRFGRADRADSPHPRGSSRFPLPVASTWLRSRRSPEPRNPPGLGDRARATFRPPIGVQTRSRTHASHPPRLTWADTSSIAPRFHLPSCQRIPAERVHQVAACHGIRRKQIHSSFLGRTPRAGLASGFVFVPAGPSDGGASWYNRGASAAAWAVAPIPRRPTSGGDHGGLG